MYFIFKEEYKGNFYPLINFLRELCALCVDWTEQK